jgi:hypothetical protein
MPRRTLAAIATIPLLLAGATACGGGDSNSVKDSPSSSAAPPATTGGGNDKVTTAPAGKEVSVDDFMAKVNQGAAKSTTAHLVYTSSSDGDVVRKFDGGIDYTASPPSVKMTATTQQPGSATGTPSADPGTVEMLMVDGVMYLKSPQATGGKFWKIDSKSDAPGIAASAQQSDPVAALKGMRNGIDKVMFMGSEDIGGRKLDHYQITASSKALLNSNGANFPGADAAALPAKLPYDVWLDDQGRFAQSQIDMRVMGKETTVTMDLDDWGYKLDIQLPPASDVVEMPKLTKHFAPTPTPKARG